MCVSVESCWLVCNFCLGLVRYPSPDLVGLPRSPISKSPTLCVPYFINIIVGAVTQEKVKISVGRKVLKFFSSCQHACQVHASMPQKKKKKKKKIHSEEGGEGQAGERGDWSSGTMERRLLKKKYLFFSQFSFLNYLLLITGLINYMTEQHPVLGSGGNSCSLSIASFVSSSFL